LSADPLNDPLNGRRRDAVEDLAEQVDALMIATAIHLIAEVTT
jgi:hypothetical protein